MATVPTRSGSPRQLTTKQTGDAWEAQARRWLEGKGLRFIAANVNERGGEIDLIMRIDAVAFVESIPFSETRGYVKNVLAYDAYYRYFMGDKPTLMSATEWGRRY